MHATDRYRVRERERASEKSWWKSNRIVYCVPVFLRQDHVEIFLNWKLCLWQIYNWLLTNTNTHTRARVHTYIYIYIYAQYWIVHIVLTNSCNVNAITYLNTCLICMCVEECVYSIYKIFWTIQQSSNRSNWKVWEEFNQILICCFILFE